MAVGAQQHRWRCACCGVEFDGLPMDLTFAAPVDWDSLDPATKTSSRIDDDLCEVRYSTGEVDRFIRSILPIPVPELDAEFRFGVWVSVSENSWDVYEAGFKTGDYQQWGCFGYLMHEVPGYPGSTLLHCDVEYQPDRMRPRIYLHETDHPLFEAQNAGVSRRQVEVWASTSHEASANKGR